MEEGLDSGVLGLISERDGGLYSEIRSRCFGLESRTGCWLSRWSIGVAVARVVSARTAAVGRSIVSVVFEVNLEAFNVVE